MQKEKLVSIILPVYNGADSIRNAIDSILEQTYTNWELIIVNDCSTDNTLEIISQYQQKDKRIKIICNEKNLKLPLTLNIGFSSAKGEYYTWTSDDNIYKPEALSIMVKALESDKKVSMVYANYTDIDADGHVLDEIELSEPYELVVGNVIGACFLYTKKIAQKVGNYDSNLFLAEDYDYWIRIYRYGIIKHISDNLYYYRRHKKSLSETKKDMINMQTYKALEKNFLFLYTDAMKHGKQNEFCIQMMNRVSEEYKTQVEEMLCAINKKYKWYQKIHRKLKN